MMKSSTLFVVGHRPPPMSTSRPPDIIHVTSVPRPSPFFALFRLRVLCKLKNKKQGRPGNEAIARVCVCLFACGQEQGQHC